MSPVSEFKASNGLAEPVIALSHPLISMLNTHKKQCKSIGSIYAIAQQSFASIFVFCATHEATTAGCPRQSEVWEPG